MTTPPFTASDLAELKRLLQYHKDTGNRLVAITGQQLAAIIAALAADQQQEGGK